MNQEDNSERSHQVAQIRAIYSMAAFVIAWLGEATSDDNLAFAFLSSSI